MLFMHDVWVNWFEGEENGYNVCHFHEWRKSERVELLDQVPLLYLESELYECIENNLIELPQQLLEDVKYKSYLRKNHDREEIEYGFIATDGKRIIAVDTMGYSIPIKKSRLIPRQERLALELIEDIQPIKYEFDCTLHNKIYNQTCPSPETMYGLTRRERQLKQLLFLAMDILKNNSNVAELRYFYSEWNIKNYNSVKEMTFDELYNLMLSEIEMRWSKTHENVCSLMIKGQPFLEKLWELENVTV